MRRTRFPTTLAVVLLSFATSAVQAQRARDSDPPEPAPPPEQAEPAPRRAAPDVPMAELVPLLRRLERESNKQFVVDRRLGTRLYLGGLEPDDVTYPVLLAILRTMGFAAVEIEQRVNIVPDAEIRFYPTPIVQTDDASIGDDEFVTRIVTTTNIESPQLVPILRPLMAQAGHLAAFMPNRIVMMDRYANVKRITEIIRSLDAAPPRD